jgi:hypothetical protein
MADVATISLLHQRGMRHSDAPNEELQTALNSRVIIEQAKGKLAERLGLDMDQAFSLLRDHGQVATVGCPTWPRPSSTGQSPSPHRQPARLTVGSPAPGRTTVGQGRGSRSGGCPARSTAPQRGQP